MEAIEIHPPRDRRPLLVAALAVAGAELLSQWSRVWIVNPELAWGWFVPVLAGYLGWLRWLDRPGRPGPTARMVSPVIQGAALACGLLIVGFVRLLLEPFPGWPLVQWIHGITILALVLLLIAAWEGAPRARHFAWPLLVSLAALPWPAVVAQGLVGEVRIGLASIVAETLNACGEPARATGTVIEVGRGLIGIDEACGGIRSLQTAVLVALVIGELRRDSWRRRLGWLAWGVGLALLANALRIGTLAMLCSRAGTGTLEVWHDRVGTLEMIFTLGCMALLAVRAGIPPAPRRIREAADAAAGPVRTAPVMAVGLIAIVAVAEIGTLLWFGVAASRMAHPARWRAQLPAGLASYTESPFTPTMQELLQCDSHQTGTWLAASGARRAGYVIRWENGHFAQYAVRLHTPDVCFTLAGSEMIDVRPPVTIAVGSLKLPFFARRFRRGSDTFYVYFLPWNLSAGEPLTLAASEAEKSGSWFARQWSEVMAHRRHLEAVEVAVCIFDVADPIEADQTFRREIAGMVRGD